MTRTYIVNKMMCNGCVNNIDRSLAKVDNIAYTIDLNTRTVVVDFNGEVNDAKVIGAIKKAGYEASRL